MKKHQILNLATVLVFASSMLGSAGPVFAEEPGRTLHAVPAYPEVHGHDWPTDTDVTLKIYDESVQVYSDIQYHDAFDTSCGTPCFDLKGKHDLRPGEVVEFSQGIVKKTVTVTDLKVAGTSAEDNTVWGTAAPLTAVSVRINSDPGTPQIDTTTGAGGDWLVDFDTLAFDLKGGEAGRAIQFERPGVDDDGTLAYWNVPNPKFNVRANTDVVEANEWTLGHTVSLAIDNPGTITNPDFTDTRVVGVAPWDPNQTYAEFNLKDVYDIQIGFLVSLVDGATTKTHTVTGLEITGYDLALDTVAGVAASGSPVDMWVCDESSCTNRHVTADESGNWTADFAHPGAAEDEQNTFDIVMGTWIDSSQCENDGDCTMYGESVPTPSMDVWFMDGNINAYRWPMGTHLSLTVEDPSTVTSPDYTAATDVAGTTPWDPNTTLGTFSLQGDFDLGPGMTVTISGASMSKSLVVSHLTITNIDVIHDTITGGAEPNQAMWMYFSPSCCRNFQANGSGIWTVDYRIPGPSGEPVADIRADSGGTINAQDDDGDNTSLNWYVPIYIIFLPQVIK